MCGQLTPIITEENYCIKPAAIRRKQINQWMHLNSKADLVIPFCDAICDETGEIMRLECDSGDGVHPSIMEGKLMEEIALDYLAELL